MMDKWSGVVRDGKLSPMHIRFALAFYYSPTPRDDIGHDLYDSEAGYRVFQWLAENELISEEGHKPTEKMTAWIDHLCKQPLPKPAWVFE